MRNRYTFPYTLLGVAFGLLFPIIATLYDLRVIQEVPVTLSNVLLVHATNPLHWIIDTMPVVLGLVSSFAGQRQDRVAEMNRTLELLLAEADDLGTKLQDTQTAQKGQVAERTAELTRRARMTTAAAEVGRLAVSIHTVGELLPGAVGFIAEQFGFYHVGIFLMDETGREAVLSAANSDAGHRLISRGLRHSLGDRTTISEVLRTGRTQLYPDPSGRGAEISTANYPETRARMAIPMFVGGRLKGILDLHAAQGDAFTRQDEATLRVLADQVAIAINNAQLIESLRESLEAERRARGEVQATAWRRLLRERGAWGYRLADDQLIPTEEDWTPDMFRAIDSGRVVQYQEDGRTALALPLVIADQVLGVLNLRKEPGEPHWTPDELDLYQALADQLSQALDAARLHQETQLLAANEQTIGEITTHIRESLDFDTILRTAAQQVQQTLGLPEVTIRLSAQLEGVEPGNGQTGSLESRMDA